MTAKKPRFEPIRMKLRGPDGNLYDVRATDARDLTAEKAVQKVLQCLYGAPFDTDEGWMQCFAKAAGMSARIVNGKVRVRREKQ